MLDEQLEFAISQYADGTLPPSQRDALEARMADEPPLAAMADEYRLLDGALRSARSLPTMDWDQLALRLSDRVAEHHAGDVTIPIYQMPWVRRAAGMAVAACVAIAMIGIGMEHGGKSPAGSVARRELAVAGPAAEAPAGVVVSQISVGPGPAVAAEDATWRYGDYALGSGVVQQQQRVVIASSDVPAQDTSATPY
jgi:hypothetical protein